MTNILTNRWFQAFVAIVVVGAGYLALGSADGDLTTETVNNEAADSNVVTTQVNTTSAAEGSAATNTVEATQDNTTTTVEATTEAATE